MKGFRQRGLWAIADAALSSASNFGLVVYGAHRLDPSGFGNLAICLAVAVLAVVSVRSVTGEVKLLLLEPKPADLRAPNGDLVAARNAVFLSLLPAALITAVGLVIGGALGRSLLAVALIAPAVSLQECIRYLAFADRRPELAALYDFLWLASLAVLLPASSVVSDGVPAVLVAWGFAAMLSCVPFVVTNAAKVRKSPSPSPRFSASHIYAGGPILLEFWLASGVGQLAFVLLPFTISVQEVGGIKAVLAAYGPVNILFSAACAVALPEGQLLINDRRPFKRLFLLVSAGLALATIVLALGLVALPAVGRTLFGEAWAHGHQLVVVGGLSQIAASLAAGGIVGLRAAGGIRSSAKIRSTLGPVALVVPVAGAWYGGSNGYLVGCTAATLFSAVVWWRAMLHAIGLAHPGDSVAPAPQPTG